MSDPTIDRTRLSAGMLWLVRGIAVTSVSMPLSLVDEPWRWASGLFGPLGAVLVLVGIRHVVSATPRSFWAMPLLGLAVLGVPMRVAIEVGVLLGQLGRGLDTIDDGDVAAAGALGLWDVLGLLTIGVTFIGVSMLALHLREVLVKVAADRWKQVAWSWVAATVMLPVSLSVGFLELRLLTGAVIVMAFALLVISLLATYRAAEDDTLDADFQQPRAR